MIRATHVVGVVSGIVLLAASPSAPSAAVTWHPGRPVQGSLAILFVSPESLPVPATDSAHLSGQVAGQALHFQTTADEGRLWALFPVPLGASDSLEVDIAVARAAGDDTVSIFVPVSDRRSPLERLRPPARFRHLPDSAVVARASRERAAVRAVLRQSHATPRLWSGRFRRPVTGRVTSAFGARRAFAAHVDSRHHGVDLAAPGGRPAHAANRGVVALVGRHYYGGLTVVLDHGAGLVTTYEHLSSARVAVGDTVARGEILGRVGATGRATGPHLHWGAYYGTVAVDALSLLALRPPR